MPDRTRILLVDASASDVALAQAMLSREFPDAAIDGAHDATTLAAALRGPAPAAAVIAARLGWTEGSAVRALLDGGGDGPAVVWFGEVDALLEECLDPGVAAAGIARKSSAGYLALGGIVRDAIAGRTTADGPATRFDLDEWPLPAALLGGDGRLLAANDAFLAATGVTRAALARATLDDCLDADAARAAWRTLRSAADGPAEVPLPPAAGVSRSLRLGRTSAGRYLATVVDAAPAGGPVPRDEKAPATPERTTREMHDIAMVFSHDLKEPVHQIIRLAHRLGEGGDVRDAAEAARLTDQLETCAERAGAMLNRVLEYLTVSSRDERMGLVDLNRCLDEALENLRGTIDEADARVIADHLPSVAGDAYQLVHLLQNLLSNAIKFRGRERPEIRISARSSGDRIEIGVHDNGIGIAEGYRERVFDMGKRLHTREEYPGAGIGLTLCRRITERHGGGIRIESAQGGGTSVIVTLPRPPEHVARLA